MKYYITVKQSPFYRQMTIEELLFGVEKDVLISKNISNTRTFEVDRIGEKFRNSVDVDSMIGKLASFNEKYKQLFECDKASLYNTFYIPKRSHGLRRIDAPNPELMNALRELKELFENDFHGMYHTAAFAYVKNRSVLDALKRHQANESRWFAKYDLTNFFGNTTKEFVVIMLSRIFPFSEILNDEEGKVQMQKALELAFLNGGLPQGTPFSPTITNIMMIPVDFTLSRALRDFNGSHFIYTRYADDFQISCRYDFDFKKVESLIVDTLTQFGAPFHLNGEKTRYGSSSGSNWNLGLMLNRENKITVGYKKKKAFQAMLHNYINDKKNGICWDVKDVQVMDGYRNYYTMIEGDTIGRIIEHVNNKHGVNVVEMIKEDLK